MIYHDYLVRDGILTNMQINVILDDVSLEKVGIFVNTISITKITQPRLRGIFIRDTTCIIVIQWSKRSCITESQWNIPYPEWKIAHVPYCAISVLTLHKWHIGSTIQLEVTTHRVFFLVLFCFIYFFKLFYFIKINLKQKSIWNLSPFHFYQSWI